MMGENGEAPSCRELAREAGVGRTYANKIIKEVAERGGIAPVEELKVERMARQKMGVGVHCLSLLIFAQKIRHVQMIAFVPSFYSSLAT